MKTEIKRQYQSGFFLSEQGLRRIAQTCQEQIVKGLSTSSYRTKILVKLEGGSIIEFSNLDDIFMLENSGSKKIKRLALTYDDAQQEPSYSIFIRFQDGINNSRDWLSIDFQIVGSSRDWTLVTASEIEERIQKVRTHAVAYVLRNKSSPVFIVVATLAMFFLFLSIFTPPNDALIQLEEAYSNGEIKNPIEAIILLEKARDAENSYFETFLIVAFAYAVPSILGWVLDMIIGIVYPAYNFYWGDYIAYYDRLKSIQNVFWSVIVLGIIVSIVSTYILKFLP